MKLKDISNEGSMFSALDTDTGKLVWFIVQDNDVIFIKEPTEFTESQDVTFEGEVITTKSEVKKPDVVTVVRYFRRWNKVLRQIESYGGITAICELNYRDFTMKVYPSFCSDTENFSKEIGLDVAKIAKLSDFGIKFNFDKNLPIQVNLTQAITENGYSFLTEDETSQKVLKRHFENATQSRGKCSPMIV